MELRTLSDDALLARLEALAASEREALADIIEHLAEVDRREIVPDRGYESLYIYCTQKLHYSEAAAFGRIRAARAAATYPEILARLRSGVLQLDAVVRLYPHLNSENNARLIEQASNVPKRRVLEILSDLSGPEPRKPDSIRPLAVTPRLDPAQSPLLASNPEVIPPPRRLRFDFEADDELVIMVERLKGLLRHKYPFANLEEVFKEAAACLLAKLDPGRPLSRATARKSKAKESTGSRRVPLPIKRLVWERDGGCCAYVSPDGRRCESTSALEYDHITPFALGGASNDPANIRLLCRPHNQRLARKRFGPRRRAAKPEGPATA